MVINTDAEFKKRFLELLKSDEEFRLAVAGLLGLDTVISELKKLREDFLTFVKEQEKRWIESNRRWEENNRRWEGAFKRFEAIESEIKRLWEAVEKLREDFQTFVKEQEKKWEESNRRWEENNKRWEENWRRWEENSRFWEENWRRWKENDRKWEEAFKRFEAIEKKLLEHDAILKEHSKRLEEMGKAIARIDVMIGRFSGRWGRDFERMVLEIFREVLEERGVEPGKVEKFEYVDRDGKFYKKGARIELDVYVHNEKLYLMEIKAFAEYKDVEHFHDIAQVVEKILSKKADKLMLITVNIAEDAWRRAKELGIDVICGAIIPL